MSAALPWDEALGFALGRLRWTPDQLWRATPRELAWAVEGSLGRRAAPPATGEDLARLMRAHPDEVPPGDSP